MSQEEHFKKIKAGLSTLDKVFNKESVNYRVLGSVLVAAINGKPHRTLGDIDILLDKSDWQAVSVGLERGGYQLVQKSKFGFSWIEAQKSNSLGFTFLLIGKFRDNHFEYYLNNWLKLWIDGSYLQPTKYTLFDFPFIGIPISSIYEGLKASNLNPKRKLDREVITRVFGGKMPKGIKFEDAFKVYLWGLEIPKAYPFFSYLYNFYGGLRVIFGKKYEVWN